jgi:hypothetical protein
MPFGVLRRTGRRLDVSPAPPSEND